MSPRRSTRSFERAALLGDVELDGGSGEQMRISRWPQIRAIAAILLLTVGLAGLIYWVLPSPKAAPQQVAVVTPDTSDPHARPAGRTAAAGDVIRADSPSAPARSGGTALEADKEQSTHLADRSINAPGMDTSGMVKPEDVRKQAELAKRDSAPDGAAGGAASGAGANAVMQAPAAPAPGSPAIAGADLDRTKVVQGRFRKTRSRRGR
jgi:hypothetical protein